MDPAYQTISYAVSDRILTITLNRPGQLNAFTPEMADELIDAFDRSDADDGIGAVIVTGQGRAFCAGADLASGADAFNYAAQGEASPIRPDGSVDYAHTAVRDTGGLVTLRIYRSLKPVIAAINGAAVGVGITMTLPMDVRLVAEGAKIGFVFARRGIVPEAASSWFLPRVVGISRAVEWCLSGRIFDTTEALAGGLVRSVHPQADLLPVARALAREIIDNCAPVSVATTRQMLWRSFSQMHPMEAHRLDSRIIYERGAASDAAEGVSSFLDKRTAIYPDRVSADMPATYPWWEEPTY
jgi:enoyl-CoA hydratase/carnithine racemase